MKASFIARLILPTVIFLAGLIIIILVSAFMYFFGDGPRRVTDFLIVFSPAIILLLLLFVAWRRQLLGGTLFIIAGMVIVIGIPVLYLIITHDARYLAGVLLIAFITGIPVILSGILFRRVHFQKE